VFCAVSSCKVYGPFFFAEPTVTGINYLDTLQVWQPTVTGINYLDMLQVWIMPQLQEDSEDFIFQQDGAPPHFHFDVRAHPSANLPRSLDWARFSQWLSSSSLASTIT
jgi:hypothetical protein